MRRKKVFLDKEGRFIIEDYNQQVPFANFLPGIAGLWGVPCWVFYVNRGQGVISFGVKDKDHSFLEFIPANKAYQLVSLIGFRTFVKINGAYYEPFQLTPQDSKKERMIISSYDFVIEEENKTRGVSVKVKYFTLPNVKFAALVRRVEIKNISPEKIKLEILDGLPKVVPLGAKDLFLKNLSRTLEAWMYSQLKGKGAFFKLVVEPQDVSYTRYVQGFNFVYSLIEKKQRGVSYPYLIIDPQQIFGIDTSLKIAWNFLKQKVNFVQKRQSKVVVGKTPCAFSFWKDELTPEESIIFYTVMGAVFNSELELDRYFKKISIDFLKKKEEENKRIIEEIKNNALCFSSFDELDYYIKNTYLDNILRGGYPYKFDNNQVYYLFARKHGDLERDYNRFELLASCFSEGEGNFRDVNQNRRMDLFFNPYIEKKNVVYFFNLLRIDSYNPLCVKGERLFFSEREKAGKLLCKVGIKDDRIVDFMEKGFYLGEMFTFLEGKQITSRNKEKLLQLILQEAEREPVAEFREGWWIDHWRYCLDLVESYLYFYPDKEEELFWEEKNFMFWDDEYRVKERGRRYILKKGKVYQLDSIEMVEQKRELLMKRERFRNFLRVDTGKGNVYKTNLMVKLLSLILNKAATCDPMGIGVEMEADKPGWCDSLNGLPSLFGSSLCETLELKRACLIMLRAMEKRKKRGSQVYLEVPVELYEFFVGLEKLIRAYFSWDRKEGDFLWWRETNSLKEKFRTDTFWGIKGEEKSIEGERIEKFLKDLIEKLNIGIEKAKDKQTGLWYTYFWYNVDKYELAKGEIKPLQFTLHRLSLFLEGFVHLLRVEKDKEIYPLVRKSCLFDRKLKMYKLNECLKEQPWEIGRSRAFPRGWLENESIWLHMEYKYLLELIKNGLYEEFYQDFFNCMVCFQEPERYGRSILENSSFIVSSVYPDKELWGRGFIARLTGATAEMLNIWIVMCLGRNPFYVDDNNNLFIEFSPILKKELFTRREKTAIVDNTVVTIPKDCFAFRLFSSVLVVYHNPKRKDTFREDVKIKKIVITQKDKQITIESNVIPPPWSYQIRETKVQRLDIYLD